MYNSFKLAYPLPHRAKVRHRSLADGAAAAQHGVKHLEELCGEEGGVGQAIGQDKGQGALKRVVRQDACVQKAAQQGLRLRVFLCFPADAAPQG